MTGIMPCPFCGYQAENEYAILLHMETEHEEGDSPFVAGGDENSPAPSKIAGKEADAILADGGDPDMSSEGEGQFAVCPIDACEEIITLAELDEHIEFHAAEEPDPEAASTSAWRERHSHGGATARDSEAASNGYRSPYVNSGNVAAGSGYERADDEPRSGANGGNGSASQAKSIESWKQILHMPGSRKAARTRKDGAYEADGESPPRKRLGKSELGKYAHENKMPDWLVSMLRKGRYVSAEGVISVLEQLLEQNSTTQYAYLCHPTVQHISKLRREGGFCGYRNIQMLSSYVVGASAPGAEVFRGKIPSIFRIQDYIENAWDMGICAQGRVETGGVKGTRKYIGTPEAQAMFLSLQIPCEAQGFKCDKPSDAEAELLASVERYFESRRYDPQAKVRRTSLPPIYFQHRGHSLTIVGLEKRHGGAIELLVFDPMFHDPVGITRYVGRRFQHRSPDTALKLYRRGNKYLKKYNEFEVLRLKPVELP
ncbi:Uu.00g086570.m01.CDS01 [Anthostomella pinea]|uniref:Uu.00g086570.m01.CDS01 n=1 Tax=Anthostomella pinea TaxID=933095 RepID=A0AAI8YJS8_9PEZI|nr:Uu.00g086570.m01.CDS01 [Anthostomella pinea]